MLDRPIFPRKNAGRSPDMGTHMKTTVEIPDALLDQAKKIAAREKTTVRMLIEQGLRQVVLQRKRRQQFRLRKVTFAGKGLSPDTTGVGSDKLREMAYEGRGG